VNKAEARRFLAEEIAGLRALSYEELRSRIPRRRRRFLFVELVGEDQATTREVVADSGTRYQLETQVFWDGKPERDIRVMVSIDDGGLSAFLPISDDFIIAPDGSFVE
jgi:hypothetical protein